jgi:hypothetical protein
MGVYRPMTSFLYRAARENASRGARHRLDEPARLSFGRVASRRARLRFICQAHCSSAGLCCSQLSFIRDSLTIIADAITLASRIRNCSVNRRFLS